MDTSDIAQHGRSRAALELLGKPSGLLDYGCGNARFASTIARQLGIPVYVCDISQEAIDRAQSTPGLHASLISEDAPRLPLQSGQLAAVSSCDVMEHMDEAARRAALAEIHRVLADDGVLVVTTPHKGLFSFADPENLKFHAPRLHRLAFRALKGREPYARRYIDAHLGGNYSGDAERHQHFSERDLDVMLKDAGFQIEEVRYYGLIGPFAHIALWLAEAASPQNRSCPASGQAVLGDLHPGLGLRMREGGVQHRGARPQAPIATRRPDRACVIVARRNPWVARGPRVAVM